MANARELEIAIPERGVVSALAEIPSSATALFVYGHGAGAPMGHPFMEATSVALAERGVATLRFNFPYAEAGRRSPDRAPVLIDAIRAALAKAADLSELPLFAGGKSMGGRLSSHARCEELGVRGLIFVGFPLHQAGRPSEARAAHLTDVPLPMLFLQGTRDKLAEIERMKRLCERLGSRATLHIVEGADHGFHVLKRSGRTDAEVHSELAGVVQAWIHRRLEL